MNADRWRRFVTIGSRLTIPLLLTLLTALSAAKVNKVFPFSSALSGTPWRSEAYACQSARLDVIQEIRARTGQVDGYNPRLSAGLPTGSRWYSAGPIGELFAGHFSPATAEACSQSIYCLLLILSPLLIYGGARALSFESTAALLAAVFAVAGLLDIDGYSATAIQRGAAALIGAGYLVPAAAGFFFLSLTRNEQKFIAGFGAALTGLLMLEPRLLLAVAPFVIGSFFIKDRYPLRGPLALGLSAAVIVAILLNSFWLARTIRLAPWHVWPGLFEHVFVFWWPYVPNGTSRPLNFIFGVRALILMLAVAGLIWGWRKRDVSMKLLAVAMAFVALMAGVGHRVPGLAHLDPSRLTPVFSILTSLAAGWLINEAVFKPRRYALMFHFTWLIWFQCTWSIASNTYLRPLSKGAPPQFAAFEAALSELPSDGRLLMETLPNTPVRAEWLAADTGREIVGYIPTQCYLKQAYAAGFFTDREPVLLGTPVRLLSDDAIMKKLGLYDVQSVIAFSPTMRARFKKMKASLKNIQETPGYGAFEVIHYTPSRLVQGHADVASDFGTITLTNASAGPLVLKYHWYPGLAATGAARVYPVFAGAGVPFIGVANDAGASTITIQMK